MDGGERGDHHPSHLIHPRRLSRFDPEDDSIPPIPPSVLKFRRIVNDFKRLILDETDKEENYERQEAQEVARLDEALDRIQHLANILKLLLLSVSPKQEAAKLKEIDPILQTFADQGFQFDDLDEEARRLCLYHVNTDIEMTPFDLNTKHINSLTKSKV